MEYGLRPGIKIGDTVDLGLNPCFNGIWSATEAYKAFWPKWIWS